jgi:hypothetical protein
MNGEVHEREREAEGSSHSCLRGADRNRRREHVARKRSPHALALGARVRK